MLNCCGVKPLKTSFSQRPLYSNNFLVLSHGFKILSHGFKILSLNQRVSSVSPPTMKDDAKTGSLKFLQEAAADVEKYS